MSAETAMQWLALALVTFAGAAAFGALTARSLFAMCMGLTAMAVLSAVAILALGAGDGALALAILGVAIAPVLLAGVLLSAGASKARARPWLSIVLAIAVVGVIAWVAPELRSAPMPRPVTGSLSGLWTAMLVFVAALACTGLLGYGERGILERKPPDRRA